MILNIFYHFHIITMLLVIRKGKSKTMHNERHQNLLDIDIHTNLIEFERIAKSIQSMPSGGMVSGRRKLITVKLAMRAIIDGIEGDFLETGCYQGGTAVLMTAVLLGLEPTSNRHIFLADSFKGLPKDAGVSSWKSNSDNSSAYSKALGGNIKSSFHGKEGQFKTSRESFETNMKKNGFDITKLQHRVTVLEGFFADTLPQLKSKNAKLSFLRLDGDLYISTMQALENAYELVQPGGYIYVDDYGSFEGCRRAVDYFKKSVGDNAPLFQIFEHDASPSPFEAVWWRKPVIPGELLKTQEKEDLKIDLVRIIYVLFVILLILLVTLICPKRSYRNGQCLKTN